VVVATLVAPVPMSEAAATRAPICCLGKGEHHCLGHELGGTDSLGLSANKQCPYSPLALAALHSPDLTPPARARVVVVLAPSAPIAAESTHSITSVAADIRPERGPPAFSLN